MGLISRLTRSAVDLHIAQSDAGLRAAEAAARAGNPAQAIALIAATRADFDVRSRYVRAIGESVTSLPWAQMVPTADSAVSQLNLGATWIDAWAAAEPDNADALVVRARSLVARAWEVRGSGWASSVGPAAFQEFRRVLGHAWPLCLEAARLAPADPTPWTILLLLCTATSARREQFDSCWSELVARDPHHREGHNFALMYLCNKWHGSHEEMYAFARHAAENAPVGSPLFTLPLQAEAEWALWEFDRGDQTATSLVVAHWTADPKLRVDQDRALYGWFDRASTRHADWFDDANWLASSLVNSGRYHDACRVLDAIGPYATELPWSWFGEFPHNFLSSRRQARRR